MINEKSLENLKNGHRFTANADDVVTKRAQSNGGKAKKRNNDLRKLGMMMLQAAMDVDPSTLEEVRQFGFSLDSDKPEAQMLLLVNAMQTALNKKVKPADRMLATDKVLEMSGMDVRTHIAEEDRKLKREQLKFEREKWLAEQNQRENLISDLPQIIDDIGGLNDADGDEE